MWSGYCHSGGNHKRADAARRVAIILVGCRQHDVLHRPLGQFLPGMAVGDQNVSASVGLGADAVMAKLQSVERFPVIRRDDRHPQFVL